jgi:signal transduction histidine kinase
MFFRNLSIRNKLTGMMLLVSTIAIISSFGLLLISNIKMFRDEMIHNSLVQAKLIAEYTITPLEFLYQTAASDIITKLSTIDDIKIGAILDSEGNIFAQYFAKDYQNSINENYKQYMQEITEFDKQYLHISIPVKSQENTLGHVYLKISKNTLNSRIRRYLLTMLFILLSVSIAIFFISYKLQFIVSRPILSLTDVIKNISIKQDYTLRVYKEGNDEIGFLYDGFNTMVSRIYDREKERDIAENKLRTRTMELADTVAHLETAQDQLVQSEKLAALGQLVAGVAHEINTPLGAIQSSLGNCRKNLTKTLDLYPKYLSLLSDNDKIIFNHLLEKSLSYDRTLTTREERKLKRQLISELDDEFENSESMADHIIDCGLHSIYHKYLDFFASENGLQALDVIYNIVQMSSGLQNMQIASERASKVVFALKNYSRYEQIKEKQYVDITQSIETVLTLYHNMIKHKIEIIKNYRPVPNIMCLPDEISQVWTNLIHNAIQAMDNHGVLSIDIYSKTKDETEWIVVSIGDNGEGIPTELQKKIFDPFFTTKPRGEGSGLGLDIVRKIIEKHSGRITLRSEPRDTVFQVYLPV